MRRRSPRTLLEALIQASDYTFEEWRERFERLAVEMGEDATLSLRQLHRWASGQISDARPAARRVAARLWSRPFDALVSPPPPAAGSDGTGAGARPGLAASPPESDASGDTLPGDGEEDAVDRRGFLGRAAGVTIGVPLRSLPVGCRPRVLAGPVAGRVGDADVERVETTTRALRGLDFMVGGRACLEALAAHLGHARGLLRASVPEWLERRLLVAVADVHNLAGWVAFDAGRPGQARRHLLEALELAAAARDRRLVASVLYHAGRVHLHHGGAMDALRLFQLGQIAAHDGGSSLDAAVLGANEAWAYAALGDAGQALAALGRAGDAFARVDRSEDQPGWVAYFGEADLTAVEGATLTELSATRPGHADAAVVALTQSVQLRGHDRVRCHAFESTMLATALLRHGDRTGAGRAAGDALNLARRVRSSRVIDRLAPLHEALAPHRHRSDLRDLDDELVSLRA